MEAVRYRPGWALGLVTAACMVMTLDITIVNVALPEVRDDLGASLADLQWVITAYTLAFASVLLAAGSLADQVGRRRVFVGGLSVFTLASLGCGLAPGVVALDVLRALQGLGGAFAFAPAMAIIAANYTGQARTKAIAVFGATAMAAGAVGPLVGGLLVESVGWRSLFLVNVPLGAAVAALALRHMAPDPRGRSVRIDVAGVLTLTVGVSAITLALLRGQVQGWNSAATLGQAGIGLAGLAAFVLTQRYGSRPLLDLSLFAVPSFTGAALVALLARTVSFGLLAYLVLFLEGAYAYSAFEVGLRLLGLSVMLVAGGLLSARLAARVPPGRLASAGFAVSAAGLAALPLADAGGSWTRLLPGLLLLGLGMGMVATPNMTIAMNVVPPERTGVASGLINSFLPLGTALGTAAFGVLFSAHIHAALPGAVADAVTTGRLEAVPPALAAPGREALAGAVGVIGAVGAAVAMAAAVLALVLIRPGDLRHTEAAPQAVDAG
ncbi:MFS transporter [Planobispora siamensis]|uniref:MFS transporter n=1 Tax=Planobispora siamensis TaxID=936338 RepID=A0A8J3WJ69_9ACTN|nr:MFS transporter [Planobispora siamensis]GIH92614.1 MFS transporter [Planobispora siamensis]